MAEAQRRTNIILSRQGGQARDVVDAALAAERLVRLFSIGDQGDFSLGPLLPLESLVIRSEEEYFVALRRDHEASSNLAKTLEGVKLSRLIHPRAYVSAFSEIAENTFVGAMAVINPQAVIGRFVFINAGCLIDHDCVIGDGTTLGPGVTFPGAVNIGQDCSIGAGVTAKPGVSVTASCIVGAGAVIVRDLEEPGSYVGNPARKLPG